MPFMLFGTSFFRSPVIRYIAPLAQKGLENLQVPFLPQPNVNVSRSSITQPMVVRAVDRTGRRTTQVKNVTVDRRYLA